MAVTHYPIQFTLTLRTLTITDTWNYTSHSANLPGGATPLAQAIVDVVEDQGLTFKSLQGHIAFGALSARTLGGQATYSNLPNGAATPFAVEPEHRISFAIAPDEVIKTGTNSTLNLAKALNSKVEETLYDGKLYKH